jgi:hypothetical protein
MAKRDKRGRSTTERFVKLPHWVVKSYAWQALKPTAAKILIEILSIYDGGNNGFLAMGARAAAERCGCSKGTAARALQELQHLGFIEVSIESSFNRKDRRACEYRVTLHKCDRTQAQASKKFMSWRPADDINRNTANPSQKFLDGITTGHHSTTNDTVQDSSPTKDTPQYH